MNIEEHKCLHKHERKEKGAGISERLVSRDTTSKQRGPEAADATDRASSVVAKDG